MEQNQLDKQIEKFTRFKALMDEYESDGITADEVRELMEALASIIADFKSSFEEQMSFSLKEGERKHSGLASQIQNLESTLKQFGQIIEQYKQELSDAQAQGLEEVRGEMPEMPDLAPLEREVAEVKKMCKDWDNGDYMIEKINTGEKKIKRERVEGLDAELKRIESRASSSGGFGVRRVFQPYQDDLSSSCNGTDKTFYLSRSPLSNVIFVFGTDFPTILRPTIDFTVSNKTLTLTSAVPAPNSGATLLVQYYA